MKRIKRLTKKQLEVLALYALNYSNREISDMLDLSSSSVSRRLFRVREQCNPKIWENATGLREAYQRSQCGLENVVQYRGSNKCSFPTIIDTINISRLIYLIRSDGWKWIIDFP